MSKTAAIITSIFIATFVGVLIFLGIQKNTDIIDFSIYDTASIIPANDNNGQIADHVMGNPNAKIFVVEYFDFSCAMCAQSKTTLTEYVAANTDNVAIITRNFPIQSIHPNSIAAASATEAAGLIKKPASVLETDETKSQLEAGTTTDTYYFEMVDAVFKNSTLWNTASADARTNIFVDLFKLIAPEADTNEFLAHMNSDAVKAKVNFDLGLGRSQGVSGTPTFFIDNQKLNINSSADIDSVLKSTVEDKLRQQ